MSDMITAEEAGKLLEAERARVWALAIASLERVIVLGPRDYRLGRAGYSDPVDACQDAIRRAEKEDRR